MQTLEVEISDEYIALNDLLKICGVVDSGAAGKALVATGVVMVDGVQELRKTNKIRPGMQVQVEDAVLIRVVAGAPEEE
ncbi:RNA-binding protein [Jeongeupia sp. HS-3]|uniref:RNA-binding S4 domain-containing protein n=1 Tax=Jeongeupia sp. HS-3 TaxID=1009682 RepID=UPI0018A3E939|nr:RNA-binding S4 domain-containing protein [Jeongeupia sp. HS-3]BCL77052.1 RNA-binding protein [Jeongeupia sp. HS-3]